MKKLSFVMAMSALVLVLVLAGCAYGHRRHWRRRHGDRHGLFREKKGDC